MAKFIKIKRVIWDSSKTTEVAGACMEFDVFKKGIFGLRKLLRYNNWVVLFEMNKDGLVNLESAGFQDGSCEMRQMNPELLFGVLLSAQTHFKEAGDSDKADVFFKSARILADKRMKSLLKTDSSGVYLRCVEDNG